MTDLEDYLKTKGIWFKIIKKPPTIHTADASNVTGISLERITKSLVFKADGKPVLAVIPGNRRVDEFKLAEAIGAEKVELVPFNEAEEYSGYPAGGTPPVHHTKILKVILDTGLIRFQTIFGGGGSRDKLIELKIEDVRKLTDEIVADISKS